MEKKNVEIVGIPCVLWGKESSKVFLVIHGKKSNKEDPVIELFANVVCNQGYQVLSFDLPKHGARKKIAGDFTFENCMRDIINIYDELRPQYEVSIFAVSIGAFLVMHALSNRMISQALFLSPMVEMSHLVSKMMAWFNLGEEEILSNYVTVTPIGEDIFSSDYQYLQSHPTVSWSVPTSILYGQNDDISDFKDVYEFVQNHNCDFTMIENGPHYFHTKEHLDIVRHWLNEKIQ